MPLLLITYNDIYICINIFTILMSIIINQVNNVCMYSNLLKTNTNKIILLLLIKY